MLEFAFVKERKAIELLDTASSNILDFVKELSAVERAAALAWANAALLAGVPEYGKALAYTPMKLPKNYAVKAVIDFGRFRRQAEDAAEAVNNRPAHDPAVSAYKWELLATQVVMVTAGASFHKESRLVARKIWKILGSARPYARDAVRIMIIYGKTYDVDIIPQVPKKKSDKAFLTALASNLPPMFRPK